MNIEDIEKHILIHKTQLEFYYKKWWESVFYDDAYSLHKSAIMFYKNNEKGKFHGFFSGSIQKFLYEGTCAYQSEYYRKNFSQPTERQIKTSTDQICKLTQTIIPILDDVFSLCPTLPYSLVVYRREQRDVGDKILDMKEGSIYYNVGYVSASLNPLHAEYSPFAKYNERAHSSRKVIFALILPANTKGYYIQNPFFRTSDSALDKKTVTGLNEYEILLPRESFWRVENRTEFKELGTIIYTMYLVKQNDIPKRIQSDNYFIPQIYYNTQQDIKKLQLNNTKINYKDLQYQINFVFDLYKFYRYCIKNYPKLGRDEIDKEYELKFYTFIEDIDFEELGPVKPLSKGEIIVIDINLNGPSSVFLYFLKNITKKKIKVPYFCYCYHDQNNDGDKLLFKIKNYPDVFAFMREDKKNIPKDDISIRDKYIFVQNFDFPQNIEFKLTLEKDFDMVEFNNPFEKLISCKNSIIYVDKAYKEYPLNNQYHKWKVEGRLK